MEGVWRAANNLQHAIFGGAYEVGRAQGSSDPPSLSFDERPPAQ